MNPKSDGEILNYVLKEVAGVSKAELARRLDKNPSTIFRYLNDEVAISHDVWLAIGFVLRIDISQYVPGVSTGQPKSLEQRVGELEEEVAQLKFFLSTLIDQKKL